MKTHTLVLTVLAALAATPYVEAQSHGKKPAADEHKSATPSRAKGKDHDDHDSAKAAHGEAGDQHGTKAKSKGAASSEHGKSDHGKGEKGHGAAPHEKGSGHEKAAKAKAQPSEGQNDEHGAKNHDSKDAHGSKESHGSKNAHGSKEAAEAPRRVRPASGTDLHALTQRIKDKIVEVPRFRAEPARPARASTPRPAPKIELSWRQGLSWPPSLDAAWESPFVDEDASVRLSWAMNDRCAAPTPAAEPELPSASWPAVAGLAPARCCGLFGPK